LGKHQENMWPVGHKNYRPITSQDQVSTN